MRPRSAVPSFRVSSSNADPTAPARRVGRLLAVAATAVLTSAVAVPPATAFELHLPDEDRLALMELEDASPDRLPEPRLYDLLPQADIEQVAAPAGEELADPDAGEEAVVHILAVGETLADVAELHGIPGIDGWRRLFDANPDIADPDLVEVGTAVRIPAPDEELERRELPAPPRPTAGASRTGGAGVWDRLAACESGGRWAANTGNGYYGGLQFSASSWHAVGGTGLPHEHSRATQIAMAERLRAAQGWGAWPACSRKLGLR